MRRADLVQLGVTAAAVTLTLAAVLTTVGIARSTSSTTPARPLAQSPTSSALTGSTSAVLGGPRGVRADALPAATPVALTAPAIGLATTRLVELGTTPTGAMEIPGGARTVGWSSDNPTPGEHGAALVVGYATFAHQRGTFGRLGDLRPGDTVSVRRSDNVVAAFAVYRIDRLPDGRAALRAASAATGEAEIRLLAYPGVPGSPGTSVVVFARLSSDSA
jgi:hypothetical protein